MKKLKLFFACLLMAVLSIGQVWAGDVTYTFTGKTWTATSGGSAANWTSGKDGAGFSNNGIQVTTTASGANGTSPVSFTNVTKVVCTYNTNASKGKGTIDVQVGTNAAKSVDWAYSGSASGTSANFTATVDYTTAETGNVKITLNTTTNSIYLVSVKITTQSSDPEVAVSPDSWDFGTVHASDAASKVFSVSGSNLTAGDLTLTVPAGFSVSPSSIAVDGTLAATEVTVSKNTSTEDDYAGNLEITGGGLAEAKTVALTMTVDADPAETGTFKLFSGDLSEGYYVICSGTSAMKNVATSSPRIDVATVVVTSENKIVNPDESVIWKVEALTGDDAGYWTFFNEAVSKYAAFNGTDGRGTLIDAVTNYAKFNHVDATSYDFQNKGKTGKYLRYNSGYGFASYGTGTGSALTLYKLDDGKPDAPTFSPAGGAFLEAQSVTISAGDGTTIYYTTDGSTPTASSSVYSTAIAVGSTTTIKAIAIKAGVSSNVASATYTIWDTPLTVTAAIALIPNANDQVDDQFVEGYVCTAAPSLITGGKLTYYISDDGSETNRLQIFKGKNLNNTEFAATSDLAIGDKVTVFGQLKNYGGTPEMNDGNYLKSYTAKGALQSVVVSGTPTKTVYSSGEDFDPAGLTVTATYASGYAVKVTPDNWTIDPEKVTTSGNIDVSASYNNVTSAVLSVPVTVASKTLESIALSYDAVEVYQGLELPKPTVTATYSEGDPEDVTALAEFTGYNASTLGDQEITVSYTFGGETKNATYTVTVNSFYNVELAASVARNLIINVVGSAGSGDNEMIIRGIVCNTNNPSSGKQNYWISDDGVNANSVEAYKGLYLESAAFNSTNKLKNGDEVVVKGKVTLFNTTPEFTEGSVLQSLARTPNFAITDVAEFEVGAADLAVDDLTIAAEGEGAVTFASSDNTDAVTIVEGKLHAVAAGTATITANLAADGIYKAATTTFDVTVIAAQVKYTITFDGNGADGGTAPEAIADKAAGVSVPLPANTWKKTGKSFSGWKVFNNTTTEEITVTAGAFTMPASAVTIQAQWTDAPYWATVYTSNVTLAAGSNALISKVKFTEEGTEYDAVKAGTGKAGGSVVVTVPAQATALHLHAAGWAGENPVISVTAPAGVTVTPTSVSATADAGVNTGSPYILENDPVDQYIALALSGNTNEIELTFSVDGGNKRFVLYGVNQEGGVLPELQSIEIDGDLTKKEYEAGEAIDVTGLTVVANYTLAGVPQPAVDITNNSDLEWTYDPLVKDQTSVTLTATFEGKNAQKTIEGLTVTEATPAITASPSFANFGSVSKDAVVAAKVINITLTNVAAATVALSGTGADGFTVDKTALTASGTISITPVTTTVGSYSAKVTISDDAGVATAATVTIMMNVMPVDEGDALLSGIWTLVTDASQLTDGSKVIVAQYVNADGAIRTMSTANTNNRASVESTVAGTALTPAEGTRVMTLEALAGGKFAFRTNTNTYLYAASSSSNYLKDQLELNDNGKWTITIDGENKAVITAQGTNSHNLMRYNASDALFSCYTGGQKDVQLFVRTVDYSRTDMFSPGVIGTLCVDHNVPLAGIDGATFYELAGLVNTGFIAFDEIVAGQLNAGVPYLFQANSNELKLYFGTTVVTSPVYTGNGLHGTFVDLHLPADISLPNLDDIYYFANRNFWNCDNLTTLYIPANRAYLKMSEVPDAAPNPNPGRRRITMGVNASSSTTGCENIESGNAPRKQLINGTIYIIRGEKVYDTTGRLVK